MADNANPENPAPTTITLEQLNNVGAISAIGLIAARMLGLHGIVTLMISAEGIVEIVPEGEIELDERDVPDALNYLAKIGYTDDQMESYLKQRDARLSRKAAQSSRQDDHR